MKKRLVILLVALGLCGMLSACGEDEQAVESAPVSSATETSAAPEKGQDDENETSNRTLVAVFSLANNAAYKDDVDVVSSATLNKGTDGIVGDTALMAQTAVKATGGDLFEIVTETPYPADEEAAYAQAQQEQLDQARPALATHVENMDDYGTIVLIYPNWWNDIPMPVATFLEEYDFDKKTLIPVCCYEAEDSGAGTSRETIAELCDAYVTAGYHLRGNAAATSGTATDFTNWLSELPVKY